MMENKKRRKEKVRKRSWGFPLVLEFQEENTCNFLLFYSFYSDEG